MYPPVISAQRARHIDVMRDQVSAVRDSSYQSSSQVVASKEKQSLQSGEPKVDQLVTATIPGDGGNTGNGKGSFVIY